MKILLNTEQMLSMPAPPPNGASTLFIGVFVFSEDRFPRCQGSPFSGSSSWPLPLILGLYLSWGHIGEAWPRPARTLCYPPPQAPLLACWKSRYQKQSSVRTRPLLTTCRKGVNGAQWQWRVVYTSALSAIWLSQQINKSSLSFPAFGMSPVQFE